MHAAPIQHGAFLGHRVSSKEKEKEAPPPHHHHHHHHQQYQQQWRGASKDYQASVVVSEGSYPNNKGESFPQTPSSSSFIKDKEGPQVPNPHYTLAAVKEAQQQATTKNVAAEGTPVKDKTQTDDQYLILMKQIATDSKEILTILKCGAQPSPSSASPVDPVVPDIKKVPPPPPSLRVALVHDTQVKSEAKQLSEVFDKMLTGLEIPHRVQCVGYREAATCEADIIFLILFASSSRLEVEYNMLSLCLEKSGGNTVLVNTWRNSKNSAPWDISSDVELSSGFLTRDKDTSLRIPLILQFLFSYASVEILSNWQNERNESKLKEALKQFYSVWGKPRM